MSTLRKDASEDEASVTESEALTDEEQCEPRRASEHALSVRSDQTAEIDGADNASGVVEEGARALQKLDIGHGEGVDADHEDVNDETGTNGDAGRETEPGQDASAGPPGPQPCDVPSFGHASFMHDDRYVPRSAFRGRGRGRHQDVWVKEEPQWVHDGYLELIAEDQAPMRMVSDPPMRVRNGKALQRYQSYNAYANGDNNDGHGGDFSGGRGDSVGRQGRGSWADEAFGASNGRGDGRRRYGHCANEDGLYHSKGGDFAGDDYCAHEQGRGGGGRGRGEFSHADNSGDFGEGFGHGEGRGRGRRDAGPHNKRAQREDGGRGGYRGRGGRVANGPSPEVEEESATFVGGRGRPVQTGRGTRVLKSESGRPVVGRGHNGGLHDAPGAGDEHQSTTPPHEQATVTGHAPQPAAPGPRAASPIAREESEDLGPLPPTPDDGYGNVPPGFEHLAAGFEHLASMAPRRYLNKRAAAGPPSASGPSNTMKPAAGAPEHKPQPTAVTAAPLSMPAGASAVAAHVQADARPQFQNFRPGAKSFEPGAPGQAVLGVPVATQTSFVPQQSQQMPSAHSSAGPTHQAAPRGPVATSAQPLPAPVSQPQQYSATHYDLLMQNAGPYAQNPGAGAKSWASYPAGQPYVAQSYESAGTSVPGAAVAYTGYVPISEAPNAQYLPTQMYMPLQTSYPAQATYAQLTPEQILALQELQLQHHLMNHALHAAH